MSPLVDLLLILGCLVLSAHFSAGETAFYSASRVRLSIELGRSGFKALLARWLMADATALIILVLIGNNLVAEALTFVSQDLLEQLALPEWSHELILVVLISPLLFFFGDLLPKEIARRRPHSVLARTLPLLVFARFLLYPLERVLRLVSWLLSKVLGADRGSWRETRGRETIQKLFHEGRLLGTLPPQAEQLAQNVLKLRSIPIQRVMVPWERVVTLDERDAQDSLYARVAATPHTRLPVVGERGVSGYVHQIDVLGAGPLESVLEPLRPLEALDPELPVDRALTRLRQSGQRLAVVGRLEAPLGLVTIKDLVEEISGELAGW
jgi:CBS domain containing-hemolysin-like protein